MASIAYLRLDDAPVDPYPIEDFLPGPARIQWQFYPKAGAKNPIPSFHVIGVDGRARGVLRVRDDEYILPGFSWTPDGASICYRVVNRPQTRQEIRLLRRRLAPHARFSRRKTRSG